MSEQSQNTTLLEQFQNLIEKQKSTAHVGAFPKYHTVGAIPKSIRKKKYQTVGTIPQYHVVGSIHKYHTIGTIP
jgi:hypothetical protein